MAIEDVAAATPEKIHKIQIDVTKGLLEEQLDNVPKNLGLEKNAEEIKAVFRNIYKMFQEKDTDLVEINPFVRLKNGKLMAADGKVTVDDNAKFRQTKLADEEDYTQLNEKERIAAQWDLNYIHIGGNIGCLVNGAGLAMATMDLLSHYGGKPANFLDVGGSAVGEAMVEAVKLVHNSRDVDSIFINIFGGILKCDLLVESLVEAHREHDFTKPIILRLKGTNLEKAEKLLEENKDLGIKFTNSFDEGAQMAVKAAKEHSTHRMQE